MKYKCGKCQLAVIVLPNTAPIKACKCDAPIIAEMTATVYSHSKFTHEKK